ncbi:MAG: hypothetical protein HY583_02030 [Candidatus Omnitrophica bacterium]|nr:hypothetical protein [Candidatus Omnitrophota bacterium]
MKICIVKQPYATELTWATHRWSNEQELLDQFVCRSQNFGLVCETRADIWVIEDGPYASESYRDLKRFRPEATKALYQLHRVSKWNEVPWSEYDVVISLDQIVPEQIIREYAEILWCYYEQEHCKKSFLKSTRAPFGAYDLFLNHALNSSNPSIDHLPASINFPYLCSIEAFKKIISAKKDERAFLDSHSFRAFPDEQFITTQLARRLGIEVCYGRPWDFDNSYLCVARKLVDSPREYLNKLASCKYFLINRGGLSIGQAVPEAAALGVIVLSSRGQIYSHYLCHPSCWVKPGDWNSAARVIKQIQSDKRLQQEILAYQFDRVRFFFLDEPLRLLRQYLEIKRKRKSSKLRPVYIKQRQIFFCRKWESLTRFVGKVQKRIKRNFSFPLVSRAPRKIFDTSWNGHRKSPCRKLSVVISGRNDSYAVNFRERALTAIERNQAEARKRNLDIEWIFVEWNPLNQDYLSYELALKGFHCYVVNPRIHDRTISPIVSHRMSFMQFFAKNVGVRRAAGDWILVTNADCVFDEQIWNRIETMDLHPEILYRAERFDVPVSRLGASFEVMRKNVTLHHKLNHRRHFSQAAGDFLLFSSKHRVGFDEGIKFSDVHVDSRFCYNWSAMMSSGNIWNHRFFKLVGRVFKADHPLTFAKAGQKELYPKGLTDWACFLKTSEGEALYENEEKWGLMGEPERLLTENVWFIG